MKHSIKRKISNFSIDFKYNNSNIMPILHDESQITLNPTNVNYDFGFMIVYDLKLLFKSSSLEIKGINLKLTLDNRICNIISSTLDDSYESGIRVLTDIPSLGIIINICANLIKSTE